MADRVPSAIVTAVAMSLAEQGLELVDLERQAAAVRVTVDRDGGIDLDGITEATRTVKRLLTDNGFLSDDDSLEVSSPGIERPLRTPEHFVRAIGSLVAVRTLPGAPGERRVEGRLDAADESGIVVDGRRLEHHDIERAHTVFEWPATAGRATKGDARRKVAAR